MYQMIKNIPQAHLIYKRVHDNESYFQCGKCGQTLTLEQESFMRKEIIGQFCNNGCFLKVEDLQVILHPKYYHIVNNLDTIRDYSWWHASYNNPENIEFSTAKDMHVGQYNAVHQIIEDKLPWFQSDYYLYKLHITNSAKIFPYIIPDYGVEWEIIEKELLQSHYNIFVYLNAWEGVGELSLITKRNALEMVQRYDNTTPRDAFEQRFIS